MYLNNMKMICIKKKQLSKYRAQKESKHSIIKSIKNDIKNNLDVSKQMVFCPFDLATVATSVTHSDWLKVVCSVFKITVPLVTGD